MRDTLLAVLAQIGRQAGLLKAAESFILPPPEPPPVRKVGPRSRKLRKGENVTDVTSEEPQATKQGPHRYGRAVPSQ